MSFIAQARLVLAGMIWLVLMASPALAQQRIATVIGNTDYAVPSWKLENASNDARLMAATLEDIGYDVALKTDISLSEMEAAFRDHGRRLQAAGPDAIGLLYFAGHGVQLQGENYLIPVDAKLSNSNDLWAHAPKLKQAIDIMELAGNAINFIILDACRDNPLPSSTRSAGGGGLVAIDANDARGLLIAFATGPGKTADDGNSGNSPYTLALAQFLPAKGKAVEQVLRQVAYHVDTTTEGFQTPFFNSGLISQTDICFNPEDCGQGGFFNTTGPTPVGGSASGTGRGIGGDGPPPVPAGGSGDDIEEADFFPTVDAGMSDSMLVVAERCEAFQRGTYPQGVSDCVIMGNWISGGFQELDPDPERGIALLDYTCKLGYIRGCNDLGRVYQITPDPYKDIDEAIHYYRLACNGDYDEGCANMGNLLYSGIGLAQNQAEGLELMRRGCTNGHRWSCELYIARDPKPAVRVVGKICEGGQGPWACDLVKTVSVTEVSVEDQCFEMIQGKVAWNTQGNTVWADQNVLNLCQGTVAPPETIACFERGIAAGAGWSAATTSCKADTGSY